MVTLRGGKVTKGVKKNFAKSKAKQMYLQYGIKECVVKINRLNVKHLENLRISKRYNLRTRKNTANSPPKVVNPVVKQRAIVSDTSPIWKELTAQQNVFSPGDTVLAKMNTFRPWPARVNTVYKVGEVLKCFVLYYGTFQIGSVLKSQCVRINDCDL